MASPIPLRTKVIVRFSVLGESPFGEDVCIGAMARVQNHYYLQYSDHDGLRALSGVGLRFLRFLPEAGVSPPLDALH